MVIKIILNVIVTIIAIWLFLGIIYELWLWKNIKKLSKKEQKEIAIKRIEALLPFVISFAILSIFIKYIIEFFERVYNKCIKWL